MELLVPLNSRSEKPLYEQIYSYIRKEIRDGSLKAAERLPSTRKMAGHLNVSRSTTQMAYEQLVAEGYIEAVPCRGYFVARIEELIEVKSDRTDGMLAETDKSRTAYQVDFSPRGIALEHFPYHVWRKINRNTLVDDNKRLFHAGNPQGEPAFRETIRSYLHSARGVNCTAEQIIVGAGSEYLLMLLSQILGSEHRIAMENPTYKQAYRVFISLGYQVRPVDMDESGMNPVFLDTSGADVAYVMPSHQYPMGIVMPVGRRQELLKWAAKKNGRYLIEDDYDSEFRYKGKPVPALQGMDRNDRVIYLGTFSQSVAPAIRVSYMVLPPDLLKTYRKQAGFYASTVSRIDQNVLYQFLSQGHFERHLNRMRAVYKTKHDALLLGLRRLEKDFVIRGEYAGLHILLTDKNGRPESELIRLAGEVGVKVYGLSSYYINPKQNCCPSTVMLGYANLNEEEIGRGAQLLVSSWIPEKE